MFFESRPTDRHAAYFSQFEKCFSYANHSLFCLYIAFCFPGSFHSFLSVVAMLLLGKLRFQGNINAFLQIFFFFRIIKQKRGNNNNSASTIL